MINYSLHFPFQKQKIIEPICVAALLHLNVFCSQNVHGGRNRSLHGIGVRKMPVTGTIKDSVFSTFTDFVAVWIGMCMYAGTIPRNSSAILGYKPKLYRGDDGCDRKEFLQEQLIVEREIPS